MGNSRMEKPFIELQKILPYSHFRTVDSFECLKAPSEFPVFIDIKRKNHKSFDFAIPWDGELYAYARSTKELLGLTNKKDISEIGSLRASLNDWDDKFAFTFEKTGDKNEYSYFVSKEDVIYLLENCCRIPIQK